MNASKVETTAKAELLRIEESTDWGGLIDLALSDPPTPMPLFWAVRKWGIVFEVVYGGPPMNGDFPEPMERFFRRLALADFSPELIEWVDSYEKKYGRKPSEASIPKQLRKLLPGDTQNGGRPRLDTVRWRNARAAWTQAVLKGSYEERRETIEFLGKSGVADTCFGFNRASMMEDRPSQLAMEKLQNETGLSESRLADLMGHRKKKK